jgi:hypothetical protein
MSRLSGRRHRRPDRVLVFFVDVEKIAPVAGAGASFRTRSTAQTPQTTAQWPASIAISFEVKHNLVFDQSETSCPNGVE